MARKNASIVMSSLWRHPGFWQVCLLVLAVLAASRVAMADEAKPVVAVVSVQIPPSLTGERAAIESSVTKGLEAAGWKVLGLADTTRLMGERKDLLECVGEACAVEIARATKAYYLVRADVGMTKRKYSIGVRFFDATDASKPMEHEDLECSSAGCVVPKIALAAESVGRKGIVAMEESASAAAVSEGKGPLVAVVSVKIPPSVADDRDGIESGVARGLRLAGWQVLGVSETARLIAERKDLRECTSDSCATEIAHMTKAAYLVRAVVKTTKSKFTVNLALFDASSASTPLAREDEECLDKDPSCLAVSPKITSAASMLGRKAIKLVRKDLPRQVSFPTREATRPPLPPAAAPVMVEPSPAPAAGLGLPPLEEAKPHSSALKYAGWAAVGAGVALLVDSGFYFLRNHTDADCRSTPAGNRCFQRYHEEPRAYLLGGIGLATSLIGAYILLFPARDHQTTVALTSRGILVGGDF